MKKFIVIYTAPMSAMEQMKDADPEESKKGMEAWNVWAKKCGTGLVDLGQPLGPTETLSPSGSSTTGSNMVGYSILQAESMEGAKKLLEGHPHLGWNAECTIEVHEALPLPGA